MAYNAERVNKQLCVIVLEFCTGGKNAQEKSVFITAIDRDNVVRIHIGCVSDVVG